jgi:hypothetical protein
MPKPVPDDVLMRTIALVNRMIQPSYVPPPIMADSVLAHLDWEHDVLEQVERSFPEANPIDQQEAAEYLRSLQPTRDESD